MKKVEKLLAILLCVVLLLALNPCFAFAEAPAETTGWAVPLGELPVEDELNVVKTTIDVPNIDPADLTEEGVYDAMMAMQADFPEGMPWTDDNYYAWHGGIFSGGYGCAGFAFLLSDAAFGTLPARQISIDYAALRPGDILRINDNTHSVIVLEVQSNQVVIAEGNFNSSIHWGRTLTKSQVEAADYVLTRWPSQGDEPDPASFSLTLRVDPEVLAFDEEFSMIATVTDENGQPVMGEVVYFTILDENGGALPSRPLNGVDYYGTYTGSNGQAVLKFTFPEADGTITPGNYLVKAFLEKADSVSALAGFQLTGGDGPDDHVPGDINGDGKVNNKDVTRLQKYLKGEDLEVIEAALDVNGDGEVNNKDLTRLQRFLKGADAEIH